MAGVFWQWLTKPIMEFLRYRFFGQLLKRLTVMQLPLGWAFSACLRLGQPSVGVGSLSSCPGRGAKRLSRINEFQTEIQTLEQGSRLRQKTKVDIRPGSVIESKQDRGNRNAPEAVVL